MFSRQNFAFVLETVLVLTNLSICPLPKQSGCVPYGKITICHSIKPITLLDKQSDTTTCCFHPHFVVLCCAHHAKLSIGTVIRSATEPHDIKWKVKYKILFLRLHLSGPLVKQVRSS